MTMKEKLEDIAMRAGLTWDDVKDLTVREFAEKLEARRAGPR